MNNVQKSKKAILKNLASIVFNKNFFEILSKKEVDQICAIAKKLTLEN